MLTCQEKYENIKTIIIILNKQNMHDHLKGLGSAILGNKRQIDRPRVFYLQNHGHLTTGNDFPAP